MIFILGCNPLSPHLVDYHETPVGLYHDFQELSAHKRNTLQLQVEQSCIPDPQKYVCCVHKYYHLHWCFFHQMSYRSLVDLLHEMVQRTFCGTSNNFFDLRERTTIAYSYVLTIWCNKCPFTRR